MISESPNLTRLQATQTQEERPILGLVNHSLTLVLCLSASRLLLNLSHFGFFFNFWSDQTMGFKKDISDVEEDDDEAEPDSITSY